MLIPACVDSKGLALFRYGIGIVVGMFLMWWIRRTMPKPPAWPR